MKKLWKCFTACAMARQLVAEAGGRVPDTAPNCSQDVTHPLRELYGQWRESVLWDRRYRRNLGSLFGDDGKGQLFRHFEGAVKGPLGEERKYLEVTAQKETVQIYLDNESMLPRWGYQEGDTLHLFAEQTDSGLVLRYGVTPDTIAVVKYFLGKSFTPLAVKSFLTLPQYVQQAYTALALDCQMRRSVLYAVAYFASQAKMQLRLSFEDVEKCVKIYNESVRQKVDCVAVKPRHMKIYLQNLFEKVDPSLSHLYFRTESGRIMPFVHFAVAQGISAWQENGLDLCRIIEDVLLPVGSYGMTEFLVKLVKPERANEIVQAFVAYCTQKGESEYNRDRFLYAVLCKNDKLTEDTVKGLIRVLFSYTIYQEQATDIATALDGPNGALLKQTVMDNFAAGCETGVAQYHFCAAAITNHERRQRGLNPAEVAVEKLRNNSGLREYLLNVTCMSLLLWCSKAEDVRKVCEKLSAETELVAQMLSRIAVADKLVFPIVSSAVEDLLVAEQVKPAMLDDAVRQACVEALAWDSTKKRAEQLLAEIPLPVRPEDCLQRPDLSQSYQKRYDDCMQDPKSNECAEVLLAVLCHLGVYQTREARRGQLDLVVERTSCKDVSVYREDKWRIGHLIRQIVGVNAVWQFCNTEVEPALIGQPLSQETEDKLEALGQQLSCNGGEHLVTDVKEALEIIGYLTPHICKEYKADPITEALVRGIRLDVSGAGSYILVSWFDLLCRYGLPEATVDFYRQHKALLDGPENAFGIRLGDNNVNLFGAYKTFCSKNSRVCEGIYVTLLNGNTALLEAFMSSEFRPMVECDKFVKPLLTVRYQSVAEELYRIYQGKFGTDQFRPVRNISLDNNRKLQILVQQDIRRLYDLVGDRQGGRKQLLGTEDFHWMFSKVHYEKFYDDQTVLKHGLMCRNALTGILLSKGHTDNEEMVRLAVQANGASLAYASERLRADKDICLAALKQSSDALPFVSASVLEDAQAVKDALLCSNISLKELPAPYCDDVDIVRRAVEQDPGQFQYASMQMRNNREIVAAAVKQPRRNPNDILVCFRIGQKFQDDKELMLEAVKANPGAYTYLSERLKQDPDILALPHWEERTYLDDLLEKIQRKIAELEGKIDQ